MSTPIPPGGQFAFRFDAGPRTVNLANVADLNGQFIYVWVYPSATQVKPAAMPVQSQAGVTLHPPRPDDMGNQARTLILYNIGGAQLVATERG